MTGEDLVKKVNSLNLPKGKYVVVGSGILGILGLREVNDIDLVVDPDILYRFLKTGDWRKEEKYGTVFLHKGDITMFSRLSWEDYQTTREEAIETAEYIQGIPFLNIKETIKFKKALNREKDKRDIKILESYKSNT